MDSWLLHPCVVLPQSVATKLEKQYTTVLFIFLSCGIKNMLMFQHACVHEMRPMKTWFAETEVKEQQRFDLNPTEPIWDKLDC